MKSRTVTLTLELTREQATDLALLATRTTFPDLHQGAAEGDRDLTERMLSVLDVLRHALARAGVAPSTRPAIRRVPLRT